LETAMKESHHEVLKVKPPREVSSPWEAFSFVEGCYVTRGF